MKREMHYSPATMRAVRALGALISVERRAQGRPQSDLAERAGISIPTLNKIETGGAGSAVGTVFELAAILGIPLFPNLDDENLDLRSALLPARARQRTRAGDNEF